jgi:hypothetical protein
VTPPAIVVRFELEARPVVFADYLDDSEAERMADWLDRHPDYARVIEDARELAERERAA